MRKLHAVVLTLLIGLGITAFALPAYADEETWFNEFHVEAELDGEGRLNVTTHIEYDFQDLKSRGVYLNFVTRQDIEGDADNQRAYEYSGFTASSSTGAATDVNVERSASGVGVYVGDPDKQNLTGVHSYEISYVVEGIPNAGVGDEGQDEIYWNIIGTGFAEPIKDFRMVLTTPEEPTQAACWAGARDSADECEGAGVEGNTATFTQQNIEPGQGVTIAAEYPAGSFDESWTIIEPKAQRPSLRGQSGPEFWVLALAGAGVVAAAGGVSFASNRWRRDEVYLGLPPGVEPADGQEVEVGRARPLKDYPVQFHPPTGQIPAEIGALVSETSKPDYLAATIVDLAVRGYLQILTDSKGKWTVYRTERPAEDLMLHERNVLGALPTGGGQGVELDDLSTDTEASLRAEVAAVRSRLTERGWFTRNLSSGRRASFPTSFVFLVFFSFYVLTQARHAPRMIIPVLFIIGVFMLARRRGTRRTAKGSAIYAQAMGFKKFLETADAAQLRFEAGEDIFSKYLPYAMVFGVVTRWVELFRSLPAEITANMAPAVWIQGPRTYNNLPDQLSGMDMPATLMGGQTATRLAAQTRSTSGSSGGSSFSSSSGGGGSVGGGTGGGGGGRW